MKKVAAYPSLIKESLCHGTRHEVLSSMEISIKCLILRLVFLVLVPMISFANPICEDILKSTAQSTTLLRSLMLSKALKEALLSQKASDINWWTAFDDLNNVQLVVTQYAQYLKTLSPEQLISERLSLDQALQENPEANALFTQLAKAQEIDYAPIQYRMRVNLLQRIIEIIKALPPEFRPRLARPLVDQKRIHLNREATQFMQDYTSRFDDLFKQTSGHTDYAAFEKALRAHEDPWIKKAVAMIDQNQIDVIIRRPDSGRFWIPKVGFQNQFVTGSSLGRMDLLLRSVVEANMTLTPIDQYGPRDAEFKPKYGTLASTPDSGVPTKQTTSASYGDDIYTLKLDEIASRLSVYMGDSLNPGTNNTHIKHWNKTFIPWSRRMILAPLLSTSLKLGQLDMRVEQNLTAPLLTIFKAPNYYYNYWETQIFGQLTLDMVKSFQFSNIPPEGEFLQELQKRQIPIYDGRTKPPTLWEGSP